MMATTSTMAAQKETPLRKRMHVLERAHSLTSLNTLGSMEGKSLDIKFEHKHKGEDAPPSSHTDYETHSSSSDDEEEPTNREEGASHGKEHTKPQRPTLETRDGHHHKSRHRSESSPMSPTTRAWYEFDLAVVVALVSPIGNWLTGGDHVKNLLLIVLLIFYLHQVIEVPWRLYQKSRPHRRAHHIPPSGALADSASPEARYAQLAASELQKFEILFLFLTFLSPLIGAALLRYATDAILGPDAVSWFSTGLFILATGMRPWIHLVERLNKRTAELHDFVHYPSATHAASDEQHKLLEARVAQLEKSLNKVKNKVTHATEDVYDYVDDAVDAVEHAMRKQDRKWDKFEGKVKQVEQVVVQLSSKAPTKADPLHKALWADLGSMKTYTRYFIERIVPNWLLRPPQKGLYSSFSEDPTSSILLTKKPKRSISGSSSSSPCNTPLETIVEEEIGTTYTENPAGSGFILARPYYFTSALIYRAGYVITAPLRAIVRMVLRNY